MKRVSAVLVLLMAILAVGLTPARADDKDDLKALDAKLTEAFKARDVKTLDKYTAEDFVAIGPLGKVRDKKHYLEHLTKGKAVLEDAKESDVKAKVLGETGVVTGLLTIKGKVEDKDIGGEYRWTRVYHKKGGDWLVVVEQHTYVHPKEPGKEK
jgi:ketosteroid isomerase-like protein